ncbi:MAG: c-type cytochrome domain-containing protein, partial [Planctomycetota bacterium]|nr:c-type cytochrome domain-containing protein [Planctomycetota bacterium]
MRKLSLIFVIFFSSSSSSPAEQISFNKHIRPILADRCFVCHGPDATTREAGLRFDREESAKQPSVDSGETAIVPGQPEMSELLRRLSASDDLQMPPPDSNLSVTQDEIKLIRRWIAEGAKWERHWSLISPVKAEAPAVANPSWPVNSIDHFILRRLEVEGLEPTRQASKAQWLRRVS